MRTFSLKGKVLQKVALLLCLAFMSIVRVYGQSLDGVWTGSDSQGGSFCSVEFNSARTASLNPYNDASECDGFMQVYAVAETGQRMLLSTYEFYIEGNDGESVKLRYNSGRNGADDPSEGTCTAKVNDGKLSFSILRQSGGAPLFKDVTFAQDGATVISPESAESKGSGGPTVMDYVIGILIILVFLGCVGHMLYELFRGARYKKVFTVDDMKAARVLANKPENMSDEEEAQVIDLLDRVFESWSVVEPDENGAEMRKPTKMKQIKASVQLLDEAIALQPTSEELVTRINELADVINSNEKRYFNGSKRLIWVGAIVGIVFCFIMLQMGITILLSTVAYVLASRTPAFLIDKRSTRGGSFANGMIASVFAMIAGARTIRTVTTYSDGHKEVDDDHSEHWVAWALALVIFVIIAVLMYVWAFFNYLRNYVLYV